MEIPVTLRHYHSIPIEEFFENRNNYRYIRDNLLYAYCNPFYNHAMNMFIGCAVMRYMYS